MVGPDARVRRERGGFSLLELLLSMTLLSLIVVGLADLFSFTANIWSNQMRNASSGLDVHDAAERLRRDLGAAYPNPASGFPSFSPEDVGYETQFEFFAGKNLLPFEADRKAGLGLDRTFVNAEVEERFSQLAWIALRGQAGALLPETFDPERYGDLAPGLGGGNAASDCYLTGYYVAYTRDSPLAANEQWSMKLFRHVRVAGTSLGQGQAGATLNYLNRAINRELIPLLQFENEDLPFLYAYHSSDPFQKEAKTSIAPWPEMGTPEAAGELPDRSDPSRWLDPDDTMHAVLYPDQAVATNVVLFRATPYKRVKDGNKLRVLDAEALCKYLGLQSTKEWPALVVPDLVDIELGVVDSGTALKLERREDWLSDWDAEPSERDSQAARVIRQGLEILRFRVTLQPAPIQDRFSS